MLTVNLKGGLGNQLFQIFCLIALALREKQEFVFLYTENLNERLTYWNNFLTGLKKFTTTNKIEVGVIYRENKFHYVPINIDNNISTAIDGYFQSNKYFVEYQEEIYKLINLEEQKLLIKQKHSEYFTEPAIFVWEIINIYQRLTL